MRVNNNQNLSFKALIFNKSLENIASKKFVQSVEKATSQLSNTKHWNLAVDIDTFGKPICEYICKENPEQIYCNGIKNADIRNNCISGTSLWIKNLSNNYKECYVSFVDLTYETVEQAKKALAIFNSNKKTLKQEIDIVKMLDAAKEIVLDETIHLKQHN